MKEAEQFMGEASRLGEASGLCEACGLFCKKSVTQENKGEEDKKEISSDEGLWSCEKDSGRLRPLEEQLPILIKGAMEH